MSESKLIVVGDRPAYTGIAQVAGARIRDTLGLEPDAPDSEIAAAVETLAQSAVRTRELLDLAPDAEIRDVAEAIATLRDERDKSQAAAEAIQALSAHREQMFADQLAVQSAREFEVTFEPAVAKGHARDVDRPFWQEQFAEDPVTTREVLAGKWSNTA